MTKNTKTTLNKIKQISAKAKKNFQNRALLVIETLVGDDIVYIDIRKLKSDIYKIAHSAINPKFCIHKDWQRETEKMFKKFEKAGLL